MPFFKAVSTPSRRPSGFTLVELLIVLGIIVVLIGLLLPVAGKMRRYSRQVACTSTLRNLGAAWVMYTQAHDRAFPPAVSMPSANPTPPGELSIMAALNPYMKSDIIWRCPNDDRNYFERYGTSYEYWPAIGIALDPNNAVLLAGFARHNAAVVPVLGDAEAFHPAAGQPTRRLAMYYDAHVDWFRTPESTP